VAILGRRVPVSRMFQSQAREWHGSMRANTAELCSDPRPQSAPIRDSQSQVAESEQGSTGPDGISRAASRHLSKVRAGSTE
jgi:hypothetical protein